MLLLLTAIAQKMSKFVSIFKVETTISELKNTEGAQSHLCKVNNSQMHKKSRQKSKSKSREWQILLSEDTFEKVGYTVQLVQWFAQSHEAANFQLTSWA